MSQSIRSVGLIGAGTMGAGIMINCVMSGLDVILIDRSPEVLEAARGKLDRYLARQVSKDRLAEGDLPAITARLALAADLSALAPCDLVIEAVFENLDLKRRIFAELESHVRPDCVLASNTSCLRIKDIAEALDHPSRFCGMHYFSPAEINPVVELVEGPSTDAAVLEAARAFLGQTRKEVIGCKDQNGFALNRFFCPYTNEAARLLDEGLATTGQIDLISKRIFDLAMGPFAVMNIIGTGTNLNAIRNLSALGAFYAPADSMAAHGQDNAPWDIEADPAPLAPEVEQQIVDRMLGSVLLPVRDLLAEGTATLADVDRGANMAMRFGNPPGRLMQDLGEEKTKALIAAIRR